MLVYIFGRYCNIKAVLVCGSWFVGLFDWTIEGNCRNNQHTIIYEKMLVFPITLTNLCILLLNLTPSCNPNQLVQKIGLRTELNSKYPQSYAHFYGDRAQMKSMGLPE